METPSYTPHTPTTSTQSPPRETVPGANERTHASNTVHTENTRKRHRTSITDTIPLTTREQEQGASGAPSPPARPNRKRPTPPQMTTQGLVASGASSPMTGKRRRIQRRHCADSPLPQERGVNEAPTPPADPSRNHIAQHQTSTQEMEASGASSLSVGQRCHTNRLQRTQPRQRVCEGGTRGALASTRLTTSLAASRPTPTPHNGRPGSWRGGRRHRLGRGGKDKGGRGMGGIGRGCDESKKKRKQGKRGVQQHA